MKLNFITTILLLPLITFSQVQLNLTTNDQNVLLKNIQGKYARVDVTMGKAKGTGGVTLGSPLPTNNFSFNIFVLGREDKQFGVIKSISIQTENFEDFFIKLNWENSVKTQGTLTGEIQILYASRKDKIETYFLTETNFSIFWWLELSNENKNQINQILEKYTLENLEYKKMIVNQNRKKQLIELRNSLSEIEIQKQNIKREIIDLNSKIKLLKSN